MFQPTDRVCRNRLFSLGHRAPTWAAELGVIGWQTCMNRNVCNVAIKLQPTLPAVSTWKRLHPFRAPRGYSNARRVRLVLYFKLRLPCPRENLLQSSLRDQGAIQSRKRTKSTSRLINEGPDFVPFCCRRGCGPRLVSLLTSGLGRQVGDTKTSNHPNDIHMP